MNLHPGDQPENGIHRIFRAVVFPHQPVFSGPSL